MRKLFLILAAGLLASSAAAQGSLADSLGDYQSRFSKLNRAYSKAPDNVENLYNLSMFYFDNSHPMRNLPMAMKYIQRAEQRQITLIEEDRTGELGRLYHCGITISSIRQTKQAIIDAAYNTLEVRTDMTGVELDTYLDAFGIDMELVRLLRQRRINQVYDEDLKTGTPESYYHFIDVYHGSKEAEQMEAVLAKQVPTMFEDVTTEEQATELADRFPLSPSVQRMAEKHRSRIAFQKASKRNDVKAYQEFLRRFPASDENMQARDRLDKLLEVTYSKCRTPMDYAIFADTYPDIQLSEKALGRMRELMAKTQDIQAARYYLSHFKMDPHYDEVYNLYYSWHAAEGNGGPIRTFSREHPDFPYQRTLQVDLNNAVEYDHINLMEAFLEGQYQRYTGYVRKMMGKGIAFVALQRMIQAQVANRNFGAALDRVRKFDICFESMSNKEYKELQKVLQAPSTGRRAVKEFGATYHVLNPSENPVDHRLYFTRASGSSRRICYAVKEGGQWRPSGEVEFAVPTYNDGLTFFGFYADGTRMVLGSEGNIMLAEREGDVWRVTDIPPYPVNTDYIETDAFMLPDGSGMLLASDRPDGHNLQASGSYFHGDTAMAADIYFIPYNNNRWGTPVNLGSQINTPYCDRHPLLSRNLKTLYFVSDGRGGLGYTDVYVATRTDISDWTSWSEPQNAGKEINTGFSEVGLTFGPGESRIYMSVNDNMGLYNCYSFPTWHDASNSYEPYVVDILGMEMNLLRVRVADLTQQTFTQTVDCAGESSNITINVHKDKKYAILGEAGDYFVPAVIVDMKSKSKPMLKGYTFPVLVNLNAPLPLYAVDFENVTGSLTEVGKVQLEQLAQFLRRQPKGAVEVCVDVAGSDDAVAYSVSLERGRVIRDFLTDHGLDASRVTVSAYGNVNVKNRGASSVSVRFRE